MILLVISLNNNIHYQNSINIFLVINLTFSQEDRKQIHVKYISSEKAAIVSVLEPVFVLLSGIILLGETVSVMQIFGTIIILSGAVITLFSKNSTNQK